ncbi:MAG: GDP-L-fucose synthase family protein [Promethearchaeota archaeon]
MEKNAKIYVAGHQGLVGSAITRKLQKEGFSNLVLKSHKELNLINQVDVECFFRQEKPTYVFIAAAKVGGILANRDYPGEFIYQNLMIQTNIIHQAYLQNVKKLLFLGSSCIYPKFAKQPISEDELLKGPLEPTNDGYALAKITGIKMCDAYRQQYGMNFISAMPTNLYGPNDNFDLESSHVLPAFIRKFYEAKKNSAKEVIIWGTGKPRREFLHVDDLADAVLFLMERYDERGPINVCCGKDISVMELAEMVAEVVGYEGKISTDLSKPDGTPRKLLDVSKLEKMGWTPKIKLKDGIKKTYDWFLANLS